MDITFNCDKCGQQLVIDAAGAGVTVDCPNCGQELTVPSPDWTTAPETPAPASATTSQTSGLRVAGFIFGLVALGHLLRLVTRAEVIVAGYHVPLWVSGLALIVAGGMTIWLWTLSSRATR
jgi:hypothetical protein